MNNRSGAQEGFTLIEMVCVLAMIGLIIGILMPRIPHQTSRSRLEGYAIEAASLLKGDRYAAIRRRTQVSTQIDANGRSIRSGSSARVLQMPDDVRFDAILPERCNEQPAYSTISFFATGMSCGGVIALIRPGIGYEIRVNWLTGGVEVVTRNAT